MRDIEKALLEFGVKLPRVMLPNEAADMKLWPVVACDQYTSEPEYWERVEKRVGDSPSTLRLILPEIYLGGADETKRIEVIHANMERYANEGVLHEIGEGFILVRRTCGGGVKARLGLMIALDLERYDFSAGSKSLVRATEGTIGERIPPRLRVREGAPLELPHALVLVDDPGRTLLEPLEPGKKLYDVELMENGGRVEGHFVAPEACEGFVKALRALAEAGADESGNTLLFAVGDGNHSLAAAKTAWEKRKKLIPPESWENDPARFALVELENVHDESIDFEAIHRVVFGVKPMAFLSALCERMPARCAIYDDEEQMLAALAEPFIGQRMPFVFEGGWGILFSENPPHAIAYGTLQNALDAVLNELGGSIDYVHGDGVVKALGRKPSSIGFILPALGKSELFESVKKSGPLPRKAFSMGHANEKRFYLEARRIL